MRIVFMMLMLMLGAMPAAVADWRAEVSTLAQAGDAVGAIELAERERMPWLAPHLAQRVASPLHYVGWVAAPDVLVAYGRRPAPWTVVVPRTPELEAAITALRRHVEQGDAPPEALVDALRTALVDPLAPALAASPRWVFATDGPLSSLPFPLLTDLTIVHAVSERGAALAALRVAAARRREPSLVAFARSSVHDPGALPAARAEIALAAAALGGDATLLAGDDAPARLQVAAYDGTLTAARFVLIATHTVQRDGTIMLELEDAAGARLAPADTLHLQFTAELVVLSACETAAGAGFADAGARAGVGLVLLTQWRIDDAASAQFVAALFDLIGRGATVEAALAEVRRAFAAGEHGARHSHPYYWSGWQLWGGL